MPIVVNLDVMLARRKMKLGDLSAAVDISLANLSILKSGRARAVRFSTLEALCRVLDCQPGDLLEFKPETPAKPANLIASKNAR
jgi:putative transcriptional regulator